MNILWNEVEIEDYTQCLDGEIAAGAIVYGFTAGRIEWQLLPDRKLDMHKTDPGFGVLIYGGYYTSRTMTINGSVIGSTPTIAAGRLRTLAAVLNSGGHTVKALQARRVGGTREWMAMSTLKVSIENTRGCKVIPVRLEFVIPKPFAVDEVVSNPIPAEPFIITI
jgi:hypothetical protein